MRVPTRRYLILAGVALWLAAAGAVGAYFLRDGRVGKLDLSNPRDAAAQFADCLRMGSVGGVVGCVVQDDVQHDLAGQLAAIVAAGMDPADLTLLPAPDAGRLAAAKITVDGDTAKIELPPDPQAVVERPRTIFLRRGGGRWRVDLLATTGMSGDEARAYLERLASATRELQVTSPPESPPESP